MSSRFRVAWFSPLRLKGAHRTSVSGYVTDTLLPYLSQKLDIEIFHEGFDSYEGIPTFHYLRAFERDRVKPFDIFFHQVEDGESLRFTRFSMAQYPGITLFHDVLFVDSGPVPLYVSPWTETVKKARDLSMPWPSREAEFDMIGPFGYRETGLSPVSLFSTERSHTEYLRLATEKLLGNKTTSYYLPLPTPISARTSETFAPSTKGEIVVGFSGSPTIQHRAHKVLPAIKNSGLLIKLLWLIDAQERAQCEALLEEFGMTNVEIIEGRSPEEWSKLLPRISIAVHTLFSAYGQPGVYLSMSLIEGIPSVVTNFGSTEYLSDSLVWKLQPGESESYELTEILKAIAEKGAIRNPSQASSYLEHFGAEVVAGELLTIFERSLPLMKETRKLWDSLLEDAQKFLFNEAESFVVAADSKNNYFEVAMKELGWR